MIKTLNEIKKKFGKKILIGEKLSKYSWFNLGGPAEILFKPQDTEELKSFLKLVNNKFKSITVLGAGSNTLIRDGGVNGAIIKLSPKFSFINKIDNETIEVGAATLDRSVSNYATDNSISGMEFLSCIPGTIGGAIKMNSGCYGHSISKILTSIKVINYEGEEMEINKNEINFFYRGCNLKQNLIILSAKLKGIQIDQKVVREKQESYILEKKNSQPSKVKTCGSTFKNPEGRSAWKLIKESDCSEISVGDAKISEKHCNFFINEGNASSNDIEKLIEKVKKKVFDNTGVNLELELKIIGQKLNG